MISNLLGLAGLLCVVVAVGGLAGILWAVLALGLILVALSYSLYTQAHPRIAQRPASGRVPAPRAEPLRKVG